MERCRWCEHCGHLTTPRTPPPAPVPFTKAEKRQIRREKRKLEDEIEVREVVHDAMFCQLADYEEPEPDYSRRAMAQRAEERERYQDLTPEEEMVFMLRVREARAERESRNREGTSTYAPPSLAEAEDQEIFTPYSMMSSELRREQRRHLVPEMEISQERQRQLREEMQRARELFEGASSRIQQQLEVTEAEILGIEREVNNLMNRGTAPPPENTRQRRRYATSAGSDRSPDGVVIDGVNPGAENGHLIVNPVAHGDA